MHKVRLKEWGTLSPDSTGDAESRVLAGLSLDSSGARSMAQRLTEGGRIEVLELARGIELRATSFVGRFRLGDLTITIEPKLPRSPLIQLMRYGYGLRKLDLFDTANFTTSDWSFQDLLIVQLHAEARELFTRGLHREYETQFDELSSPRGRIDFGRCIQTAGRFSTTLPCIHHPRQENTLINQTLLAGVRYAARLTNDLDLRTSLRRLASSMCDSISYETLSAELLSECRSRLDRRTGAYISAIEIIELLFRNDGVAIDEPDGRLDLNGFLFDMNRFFQALVSRFLSDHLDGYEIEEESRLKDLFVYDPQRNARGRHARTPRPDFIVRRSGETMAILDTKYRDLWEKSLPREMLYQLGVYALSQPSGRKRAIILYPTLNPLPCDQGIFSQLFGGRDAEIILRPVNLIQMNQLLRGGDAARRERVAMAHRFVFGDAG